VFWEDGGRDGARVNACDISHLSQIIDQFHAISVDRPILRYAIDLDQWHHSPMRLDLFAQHRVASEAMLTRLRVLTRTYSRLQS
jgi:hypothetical protein